MSKYNRMSESVAASDLLQALNTLQHSQVYEEELSFGNKPTNPSHSEQCMNFEIYMQRKTMNPMKKEGKQMKKSVTPLKDTTNLTNNRGRSTLNKQRNSMSPLNYQNVLRGTHQKSKKKLPKNNQKQNSLKNTTDRNQSMCSSKLSCQTKKILTEKEKKGKTYVPIHQRAEQLLKERQIKLTKLQKEREMAKMIEEKECTFKPKIIKSHFKATVPHKKPEARKDKKLEQQSEHKDNIHSEVVPSFCEEQTLKEPEGTSQILDKSVEIGQQTSLLPSDPQKASEVTIKKYKNQKFNKLLDFLL